MGMKRSCRRMWGMGKAGSSSSSPPALAYMRLSGDEKRSSGEGGGRGSKGKVSVLVGGEADAMERLLIPTEMMKHPAIAALLQMSADEFRYQHQGAIRIPCDANSLRATLDMISKHRPSRTPFLSHKICPSTHVVRRQF